MTVMRAVDRGADIYHPFRAYFELVTVNTLDTSVSNVSANVKFE